ncbi:prepilin-type N-terminal cleavage/methylation domain-containing protein [Paenibacillus sp. PL2-23]|uniref:pilus assembly FimT family protein n=1 Tax=Paenibacillus sp. PL2-23 TaxID=2100729 RepID=UPI0030F558E7
MKEYAKRLQSGEKGFTLIELIASMALISIFGGIMYTVITFGVSSHNKIQIENGLRDEADLLMSAIINELYTIAPDKVREQSNGIQLIETGVAGLNDIYIDGGQLHIRNAPLVISSTIESGSSIKLDCEGYGESEDGPRECATGLIEIDLVLSKAVQGQSKQLTLRSKFGF